MTAQNRKSLSCTIKGFLFLLLTTTIFPANHLGESLHHDQEDTSSIEQRIVATNNPKITKKDFVHQPLPALAKTGEVSTPVSTRDDNLIIRLVISRPMLYLTALVPLASLILINIILAYLCDQPTNKQCLINLLYRDILSINITHVCLWSFGLFYCEYKGQKPFDENEAKFIAYMNQMMTFLILVYLNTIGILRLCTIKLKQVDLLVPYLGECDEIALRNIRFGIFSSVAAVFGAIIVLSIMPPVYYPLSSGVHLHIKNFSVGSTIVIAFQLLLLSSCVILHIGTKICAVMENIKVQPILMKEGKGGKDTKTSRNADHDATINIWFRKYSFIGPIILNVVMVVGLASSIIILYFVPTKQVRFPGENNVSFWWIASITIGFEGVFFPFWLIIRNRNLRSYAKKHTLVICTKLASTMRKLPYLLFYIRRQNNVASR